MNNDLSLSGALGGLRITNPDDATSNSPQPRQIDSEPSLAAELNLEAPYTEPEHLTRQSRSHTTESRTSAAAVAETELQSQPISYDQPYSSSPSRPISTTLYNSGVTAAGRVQAANSYQLLRSEQSQMPAYAEARRNAPAVEYSPDIPSRESSHRDRSYHYNRQSNTVAGNGPMPPRDSSRAIGSGYASVPGIPVVPEPRTRSDMPGQGGSEEWKDRGAAVGMRKEIDANGKTVMKPVKKGVRDFTFGPTLGEGSYSTVYLATDRQTLKEYAVKVLEKRHIIKEKKIKYVNIEKDTLNRLTEHPGIVRLYYTFQDESSLYYVLDLCNGGELLGVLKKTGTFDVDCTKFFGAQILDAIEYMHSRGVIHRDLKPENVLLDDQMHVKITDFGTAKLLTDPRAPQAPPRIEDMGTSSRGKDQDDSRAASFVGTAEYVSPELLTNKNACKASDLWAFGCIIYQLLAGRPPFKGGSEYLTFQKIVSLDYQFPAGFPPAAQDLIERCLVLDPARRLTIEHIKNHEFFDGQQWGKALWRTKAPRLRPYVPPSQDPKIIQLSSSSNSHLPNSGARPHAVGNGVGGGARNPGRIITDIPPPSQLDIEWSPVLTKTYERILRLGDLLVMSSSISSSSGKGDDAPRKFARFFGGSTTKKRPRLVLVTSSGRIILAPAGGEDKRAKQEISLLAPDCSWRTQIDAKGQTVWCVDSAGMHYTFEDVKAPSSLDPPGPSPDDWVETVQQAKDFAVSMNLSGNDNGFGEVSSSMSSPTSTFEYSVSDRSHRGHFNKSQASLDDATSTTKRHRFSKRQSKQGLGAAF